MNMIKSLYKETKAKFKLGNIETDWIESKKRSKARMYFIPIIICYLHGGVNSENKEIGSRGKNQ